MRYDVTPLTSITNATDALRPYPYVTDLAAAMEASSSHATMNCVTSSYTSLEDISPLTLYTVNIASTRYASHHRSSYVGLGVVSRQEVIFSSEAYGKFRMTPSSMSYLEMMTQISISMIQQKIS